MEISNFRGINFPNGSPKISYGNPSALQGELLTVSDKHIQLPGVASSNDKVAGGFMGALKEAIGNVEGLEAQSQQLTEKMIYDPDSVEAHEVMIAAEKSRFALNLTKTLSD